MDRKALLDALKEYDVGLPPGDEGLSPTRTLPRAVWAALVEIEPVASHPGFAYIRMRHDLTKGSQHCDELSGALIRASINAIEGAKPGKEK